MITSQYAFESLTGIPCQLQSRSLFLKFHNIIVSCPGINILLGDLYTYMILFDWRCKYLNFVSLNFVSLIVFKTTKIHWDIFCRSPGAVLQSHITCPSVVAKSGGYNFIETIIFAFHSIDVPSACFSAPGQIFWHSLKFFCMSAVEKSGVSLLIYT